MHVVARHKVQPVEGIRLFKDLMEYTGPRDAKTNPIWRVLEYHTIDGLRKCSADLQLFFLCLVALVRDVEGSKLTRMSKLTYKIPLYVTTFTSGVIQRMASILGWSDLVKWHRSLSKLSLDWSSAIALTWSTFVHDVVKSSGLPKPNGLGSEDEILVLAAKTEFLDSAVASFHSKRKAGKATECLNPLIEPLPTLLAALLLKEDPPDSRRTWALLEHSKVAYEQVSLPFPVLTKIAEVLPSFPLEEVINLQPVHRLQGEIRYAVGLERSLPRQKVLKVMAGSYLSRALLSYEHRAYQNSANRVSSHEDILEGAARFLANPVEIAYVLEKTNALPLSYSVRLSLASPFQTSD